MAPASPHPWRGILRTFPVSTRGMIGAFLLMIAGGYLFALLNIVATHSMADGRRGLSFDDLRAVYSGLTVERGSRDVIPSRMLQMIEGAMRQYLEDQDDFEVLRAWLASGGAPAGLDERSRDRTPRRVIILNCLRCHAADANTDISRKAPFGPDQMTVDPQHVARVAAAREVEGSKSVRIGPQETRHLILITHAHMLAIPIFTLIVGGLFALVSGPPRAIAVLTPAPMLALLVDFSGWWLARLFPPAIGLIVAGGAVFGLAFAVQLLFVGWELLRGAPPAQRR
ncbi:MAG: hypothetical protein L6Q92_07045 [Phycisphaerae bacterium]|nr:hypothetical protein [Phycisphaerae bacterium]